MTPALAILALVGGGTIGWCIPTAIAWVIKQHARITTFLRTAGY